MAYVTAAHCAAVRADARWHYAGHEREQLQGLLARSARGQGLLVAKQRQRPWSAASAVSGTAGHEVTSASAAEQRGRAQGPLCSFSNQPGRSSETAALSWSKEALVRLEQGPKREHRAPLVHLDAAAEDEEARDGRSPAAKQAAADSFWTQGPAGNGGPATRTHDSAGPSPAATTEGFADFVRFHLLRLLQTLDECHDTLNNGVVGQGRAGPVAGHLGLQAPECSLTPSDAFTLTPRTLQRTLGTFAVCSLLTAVLLSSAAPSLAITQAPSRKLLPDESATVQLFNDSTPSVVFITNLAARRDTFTLDVTEVPQGSGSGFIWDTQGHVVTNFHVIRGASDLRVTLSDQSVYPAKVVGFDQDKDVAVLFIDAPPSELRPLKVGSSSDLMVGQRVFAIGNPFGLDHTLTTGIISGLRREISSAATGRPIQDVIQTDAAINPGNSGGPLLDSAGSLIGINTAIYSPSGASAGVGFSIPVDTVSGIVEQIVKYGKVTRPVLGISFAPEQAVEQLGVSGVLVLDAPPSGPAGKAGLRPTTRDNYGRLVLGDIITGIDGQPIRNGSDLYKILDRCKVGQTVDVTVLRGDDEMGIPVTLEPKA